MSDNIRGWHINKNDVGGKNIGDLFMPPTMDEFTECIQRIKKLGRNVNRNVNEIIDAIVELPIAIIRKSLAYIKKCIKLEE